ncbi:MAG: CHAD domain-containing protein [Bacteroidota bacterium]|nr:CHAD domain-containing protein [Bacteroidota bacterium]
MELAIVKYYQKHQQQIIENFQLSLETDNVDAIHDMRVSFKRFKILLQILEKISDGKIVAKHEYVHFNELFKKSGRLRDLHVQRQLLDAYKLRNGNSYGHYSDYIERRLIKRRINYLLVASTFLPDFMTELGNQCRDLISAEQTQHLLSTSAAIITSKLASISRAYKRGGEPAFHEIRREFKEIQYLNNIMNNQLPIKQLLNIDALRVIELGQMLGAWHDKWNGQLMLDKFLSGNQETDSPESYYSLLQLIKLEKENEYQQIDKILQTEVTLS